jgi:HlyD family secretion protein
LPQRNSEGKVSAEINNVDEVVNDLDPSQNMQTASERASNSLDGAAVSSDGTAPGVATMGATATRNAGRKTATQPRGFQHSFDTQPVWPPVGAEGAGFAEPKPLPRQPKGRFIIGGTLFAICCVIASAVWNTFLGVSAYGLVELDTLEICAPWEGTITEYHVTEGQDVKRGQILASIESPSLRRQLQRLQDEMNVAKATLDATASKLKWESQSHAAEYFELWGSFLKNREELLRIDRDLARARKVADIIADEELDHLELSSAGQRAMLEKMASALKELRARSTGADQNGQESDKAELDQLRPAETRVEYLFGEIHRLEQQLEEGQLLSPVDGVVVKRSRSQGQRLQQSDPVMEIVDSTSSRIVLYVQQDDSASLPEGTTVELRIDPVDKAIEATVQANRERFEAAPAQIRRYYLSGEPLLPIIVRPSQVADVGLLQDGAVVRLTLFSDLLSTERPEDRRRRDDRTALNEINYLSE